MTKIWGFDLSTMSWSAFSGKNMMDSKWHLRKERIVVYKIAMMTGLAAECCATYALSKYNFHESDIESASSNTVSVHNNDIYASACVTIVFCVLVATLFGADFFFLVFWPNREYPGWYRRCKKALAVGITSGMTAAALMSTIIIGTHQVLFDGPPETIEALVQQFDHPPVVYKTWPTNIAWVVLLWIATLATLASTILMFRASSHDTQFGAGPYPRGSDANAIHGIDTTGAQRTSDESSFRGGGSEKKGALGRSAV